MAYNELFSLGGGVNTDDANATASQILSGYTAYVKGKKVTGNIPSQGAQTITPGTTNKTISSGRYLSGTQTIKGDANLVAGNIKKGTSIFGVSGTFTSDANAGTGDILSGKTAYVNGSKITGSIVSEANISDIISHIHINESTNPDYPNFGLYLRFKQGLYYNNNTSGYPELFFPYSKPDLFPSAITSFCIYSGGASNDWKYADMQYAWGSAVNLIQDGKWIINIPGTYTIIINAISTWNDPSNIYFGYKFLVNGNIVMHDENYVLTQIMGNHILTGSMNCNSGDEITFQYISRNVNGFFQVFLIKTK